MVLVLLITLTPSPVDRPVADQIERVLQELHERGLPEYIGYGKIEFSANIAMFVPVGFFLALLLSARLSWLTLLIGPLLSAAIESVQRVLLPERYASVLDILANGAGVILGLLVAVTLRAVIHRRDALLLEDVRTGRRPVGQVAGP